MGSEVCETSSLSLGLSKISSGLCLSFPKLHRACAWHRHAFGPFMIKYQGTPLDILLAQQDGWNGQNKVGCVCSLSHQRLPFFCPAFLFSPFLCMKYVLGKRDGFRSEKEIFSAKEETHISVSYLMLPLCFFLFFLCVSAFPPFLILLTPTFFFSVVLPLCLKD